MLDKLKKENNWTITENAGWARKTTNSALLDLFSQIGSMRTRPEQDKINMFEAALQEDPLLATKMLFYNRDIRCGQGERETFRTILKYLANNHTRLVEINMPHICAFGRWDDYYTLEGTPQEERMFQFLHMQLNQDIKSETPSLLAKWLKSENTSSKESQRLATKTRKHFGMTSKTYRKTLSELRRKLDIVEKKMSKKMWQQIQYEKVPSRAMMIYRKAFERHNPEGFKSYIESLEKGETTIKGKTLYPYDIVRKVMETNPYGSTYQVDKILEEQWKALPDYIQNPTENSIAVVDTSGSMNGTPITIAIGLGIYLAQKAKGPYKDHFITFSEKPTLERLNGTTLTSQIRNLENAKWGFNTNIESVFKLILDTAIKHNIPQEQIINKIYIISDMEFDQATTGDNDPWSTDEKHEINKSVMGHISDMYAMKGYKIPKLVFWNVDARQKQYPMSMDERGFLNVSGASPTIFKNLMKENIIGPTELMLDVLNSDRYKNIKI